jgi:stalled ribosome alternative rescue factor ArfA
MSDRIRHINRVARDMAYNRRRQQVVKPKKGKGSYERQDEKEVTRYEAESYLGKRTPDES